MTIKPRVDREAGVIHRVKFLGNESENGRAYELPVRKASLHLYEGVNVNQNHPEGRKLDRKVQDWVGVLRNVSAEADGNYGDLHMRTKHSSYEELMEAAEKYWENFGLSHVAFGDGKKRDGRVYVTSIDEVDSVDIVIGPATVSNLFESKGRRMTTAATTKPRRKSRTLKAIVESTGTVEGESKRYRQILMESIDGDAPALSPETTASVPENASADDAVKEGILSGIMAKLREADGATLEKVAKDLGMGTKLADILNGGKKEEPAGDPPAGDKAAEELKESKDRAARAEAKVMLLESGRKATEVMINALANAPVAERKALMESWAPANAEGTAARPIKSPPLFGDEDEPEDELSEYDKRIMESAAKSRERRLAGRRL